MWLQCTNSLKNLTCESVDISRFLSRAVSVKAINRDGTVIIKLKLRSGPKKAALSTELKVVMELDARYISTVSSPLHL